MRVKERKRSQNFHTLRNLSKKTVSAVTSKGSRKIFLALILLLLFFSGLLAGLIFSGFFGTLDNPSQKALNILHSMGISGLTSFKAKMGEIASENINIPINYVKGQFSDPKQLYIDIEFEDYQRLEYKRDQAVKRGQLITSPEDYVPARIRVDGKDVKVDLRLKGDLTDHFSGNKWSFRIKVDDDDESIMGMKTFSIQDPKTRRGVKEFVHLEMLKHENIVAPRYDFVEVFINGENKGIYAFEEHFDKQIIESNGNREGIILKFNEDSSWQETFEKRDQFSSSLEMDKFRDAKYEQWFFAANIDVFKESRVIRSEGLSTQYQKAQGLLESFRRGDLSVEQVFDTDKLATYFALEALNGCGHGSRWGNIRFYYNPVNSKIEPVGYDGDCWKTAEIVMDKYFIPEGSGSEPYYLFFDNEEFVRKYVAELERISEPEFLDQFFEKIDPEIESKVNIIHKDNPFEHFSKGRYYSNQKQMKDKFNPVKDINAYYQEFDEIRDVLTIYAGNLERMPLEIESVSYADAVFVPLGDNTLPARDVEESLVDYRKFELITNSKNLKIENLLPGEMTINYRILGASEQRTDEVFRWNYISDSEPDFIRRQVDINSYDLLEVDQENAIVNIKQGNWKLSESVIIPKGYTVRASEGTQIDLVNGAMILSHSPIRFVGSEASKIRITSSDGTGEGLSVMEAGGQSRIKHVIFDSLTSPYKDDWNLMGAVNIYESPIELDNVIIRDINAEDGLNIINTEYVMREMIIQDSLSDCFDSDISRGTVIDSTFINCGNDGLDFGGSEAEVRDVKVINIGDKGLSAGEGSRIIIDNLEINGDEGNEANIAISSKDSTNIFVTNLKVTGANYAIAVYRKKPEFLGGSIEVVGATFLDVNTKYLVEEGAEIIIDGERIEENAQKVYETLYGEG